MIITWEEFYLRENEQKCFDSSFQIANAIQQQNFQRKMKSKGLQKYEGCIIKANNEKQGVVINTMIVYHFYDPDLGVDIFFVKEGATE